MRVATLAWSALLLAGAAEACTRVTLYQHFDSEAMKNGHSGRRWRMWLWDQSLPRVEMNVPDIFNRVGGVDDGGSRLGHGQDDPSRPYQVSLRRGQFEGLMTGTVTYPHWNSKPREPLITSQEPERLTMAKE